MRPAHWLFALIVVGALAWWTLGHPGYETQEQRAARVEVEMQVAEEAKPKLYRWRDANGETQITDQRPKGRKYTVVDMDKHENVNVIPMSDAINPPDPNAKPADKAK